MCKPKATASRSKARATTSFREAPAPASFLARSRVSSTTSRYSGIWAALAIRLGLVVASRGLNRRMASKSPVSATTTVISRNCSRRDLSMLCYLTKEKGNDDIAIEDAQ